MCRSLFFYIFHAFHRFPIPLMCFPQHFLGLSFVDIDFLSFPKPSPVIYIPEPIACCLLVYIYIYYLIYICICGGFAHAAHPLGFFRRVVRSNAKMHEFFVANINFPPTPTSGKAPSRLSRILVSRAPLPSITPKGFVTGRPASTATTWRVKTTASSTFCVSGMASSASGATRTWAMTRCWTSTSMSSGSTSGTALTPTWWHSVPQTCGTWCRLLCLPQFSFSLP